ncbi:hypothetical protein BDR03DRAFT_311073 [Suillus americanus]|nr:hypothetical protein BDR03DRAFT_311073 [Suillus americanus]
MPILYYRLNSKMSVVATTVVLESASGICNYIVVVFKLALRPVRVRHDSESRLTLSEGL